MGSPNLNRQLKLFKCFLLFFSVLSGEVKCPAKFAVLKVQFYFGTGLDGGKASLRPGWSDEE